MGGVETHLISMRQPQAFSAYGILSGGTYTPDEWKGKEKPQLLFESCGSKEYPKDVKASVESLKAAGYNAHSFVSEGTAHEFDMAPELLPSGATAVQMVNDKEQQTRSPAIHSNCRA